MKKPTDLSDAKLRNRENYEDLLVSITANRGQCNLLIAVCDDDRLREETIARYEVELQPQIPAYRVTLARGEPSLRAAIASVVDREPSLQARENAVITVIGAEQLHVLKLGAERPEQEIFLGYLQWTREALRQFPFSIVLWVTYQLHEVLASRAPDFWSWRNGVFWFISKKSATVEPQQLDDLVSELMLEDATATSHPLPIQDLQALVQTIEQTKGGRDPSLITLYTRIGQVYQARADSGECQNYRAELDRAIAYYQKAIALQEQHNRVSGYDPTLSLLASAYETKGDYEQAESLYERDLDIKKGFFEEHDPAIAASLTNLAGTYHAQGNYAEAIALYEQALAIYRADSDERALATTLNYLAGTYHANDQSDRAEKLYREALAIRQRVLGEDHTDVATILNNLALLDRDRGRYSEAQAKMEQVLELKKRTLGEEHPDVAASLNNLALLHFERQEYLQAEKLLSDALQLRQKILGEAHPDVIVSLNNLAGLYKAIAEPEKAIPLYDRALSICQQKLSPDHPIAQKVRASLESLRH